jgi:hypothetical protein
VAVVKRAQETPAAKTAGVTKYGARAFEQIERQSGEGE